MDAQDTRHRLIVTLPGELHAWVRRQAAARRDGSMAAVIREALELAQQADAEQDEAQEWQLEAEANLTESPLSAQGVQT